MLIADAAAVVDFLAQRGAGGTWVRSEVEGDGDPLQAPQLIDYEVVSSLRRLCRTGVLPTRRGAEALEDLRSMRLTRHAPTIYLKRIWALRETHTAYDASYIALAVALDCPLLTTDERLARSHGHAAAVRSPFTV